jgi:hypothetical protein
MLRGAVLIRILGRQAVPASETEMVEEPDLVRRELPSDLQMALTEPAYHPEREVWKALKEDGMLTPTILIMAVALATASVLFEALLPGVIQIAASPVPGSASLFRIPLAFVIVPLLLKYLISTVLRMGAGLRHACDLAASCLGDAISIAARST